MKNSPGSMLAAILVNQNEPLVIDYVDLPKELSIGQVLVKLKTSGICGSQLGEISGVKGPDRFLPHLMGHEGFGTILDVGPGVKNVKVGDSVVLHWRKGLGIQAETPSYNWKGKNVNAGWVTTFNTHAIVSENRCTTVPSNTPPELAALFGCAITTGFGVVENNAQLRMGESVVIFGAGGIGLNIIQAASLVSAYPIIAVDLFDGRLQLAKQIGATHIVNSKDLDPEKAIEKSLSGQKLDVFIDNTGVKDIIELGYKLTHAQGRLILVGVPRQGVDISIHSLPLHFGKIITGSHGGECDPTVDIPRYMRLLNQGMLTLDNLITASYPLPEINSAIEAMKDGSTSGRVMITL